MNRARNRGSSDALNSQQVLGNGVLRNLTRGIFSEISVAETRALLGQMKIKQLAAGKVCCRSGDASPSFFIVLDGILEVSRTNRLGKTVTIGRLAQGAIIGEIGALTRGPRTADVQCHTACLVGEMTIADLETNLAKLPNFSLFVMRSMAQRVSDLTSKVMDFATEDVPTRVLGALRTLPVAHDDDRYGRRERPTHAELARLVGTSREVVGRALKLLEGAGEIEQDRRYVYLKRST
ncbi:MAG: Crp/Fnr family transcriptional regulator [Proteobacteria bacterium]|nr:Crp/Fnr family transcriptional regulator [Pseudomonadota bacterium]